MENEEARDQASPKTQRRVWRRVWITVAVVLVAAPMLLWLAIDFGGKRAWREVRERLQANGEATAIDDLEIATREEVPDEENFAALPWLTGGADGSESAAMAKRSAELVVYRPNSYGGGDLEPPRSHAAIGIGVDLEAWAAYLDEISEEDSPRANSAGNEMAPAERVSVQLERFSDTWRDLEAALPRPHAHLLPLFGERIAAVENPHDAYFPGSTLMFKLAKGLNLRTVAALQSGDLDAAERSLEIIDRLVEAASHERSMIGFLLSQGMASSLLDGIVEALWTEGWTSDAKRLERIQQLLERRDFRELLARSFRDEAVVFFGGLEWLASARRDMDEDYLLGTGYYGFSGWLVRHGLPDGWFANQAAEGGDLLDRTLFDAFRRDANLGEVAEAAERMETEMRMNSLSLVKKFNHHLAHRALITYAHFTKRTAFVEARRRQAIVACALHRYRLDHAGRLPQTLEALVPEYLDAVPSDPIDGAPMRYTAGAGGVLKLYSIGLDRVDDGGELQFDWADPVDTRLHIDDYFGDWPWPFHPIDPADLEPDSDEP